jgi:hypothetical protein
MSFLRLHPAASEAVDEVTDAVSAVARVAGRQRPERFYRGPCTTEWHPDPQQPEVAACCVADLYAKSHQAADVICEQCAARHDSADRKRWLRARVTTLLYTKAELLKMLPVLSEFPPPPATLDGWIRHGRLPAHGNVPDPDGAGQTDLYLVEDVLFLIATERSSFPCQTCGKGVRSSGRAGQVAKYCSEECRREADKVRKRAS